MLSEKFIKQIFDLNRPIYLLIDPLELPKVDDRYFNFHIFNSPDNIENLYYPINSILDASLQDPIKVMQNHPIVDGVRIAVGHDALVKVLRANGYAYAWVHPAHVADGEVKDENSKIWTDALTMRLVDQETIFNKNYARSLLNTLKGELAIPSAVADEQVVTYTSVSNEVLVVEEILSELPDSLINQKRFILGGDAELHIPALYRSSDARCPGMFLEPVSLPLYTVAPTNTNVFKYYQYLTVIPNGSYYLIDFCEEVGEFSVALIIGLLSRLDEMYRIVSGAADKRTSWQTHMILFGVRYTVVGHSDDYQGSDFTDEIPDDAKINGIRLIREK